MYINIPDMTYNDFNSSLAYIETINVNITNNATFLNADDIFNNSLITVKSLTEKEKIFNFFDSCIHFGEKNSSIINKHIKKDSIKEQDNFFKYYD